MIFFQSLKSIYLFSVVFALFSSLSPSLFWFIKQVVLFVLVKNFKKYQFLYKGELGLSSPTFHVCFHISFLGCFTQQCIPNWESSSLYLFGPGVHEYNVWVCGESSPQALSLSIYVFTHHCKAKPSSIRQYFWGCSCVLITFPAYQHKNESNIV